MKNKKVLFILLIFTFIVCVGCKAHSKSPLLSEFIPIQTDNNSEETSSLPVDEIENILTSSQIIYDVDKSDDDVGVNMEEAENKKTEIVLENIGSFCGELPLPEDFVATVGKHILHYDQFSFLVTVCSDLITSESAPECFDDKFSYIYTLEELSYAGRELTSENIKKISVGDQIGGLFVDKASIDFCLEIESSGAYSTYPESAFLELSGSTKLSGIVIENNDSKFYVYRDSIVESEFPFINIGETGFSASFDTIGLHNSYSTLCFVLSDDTINQLEFNDKGYCEIEITFSNIKQSWNRNDKNSEFCSCTAEYEMINKN